MLNTKISHKQEVECLCHKKHALFCKNLRHLEKNRTDVTDTQDFILLWKLAMIYSTLQVYNYQKIKEK